MNEMGQLSELPHFVYFCSGQVLFAPRHAALHCISGPGLLAQLQIYQAD